MDNIKPCPFCGARPHVWQWGNEHTVIECANYDVDTHRVYMQGDSVEEVVAAWNQTWRHVDEPPKEDACKWRKA